MQHSFLFCTPSHRGLVMFNLWNNLVPKASTRRNRNRSQWAGAGVQALEQRQLLVGAFSTLTNPNPRGGSGLMLLMTDGSVIVQTTGVSKTWTKLTPDSTGNYQNGTWTPIASMQLERLWYSSTVLPDGRVLVVGGQNTGVSGTRTDTNRGEIYNPATNAWTPMTPFPQATQGSGVSVLLPSGLWLVGSNSGGETYLYNPATDKWSQTGSRLNNEKHDQTTWILLKDGSVLSYNPASPDAAAGNAQRYFPATGKWVATNPVPVPLTSDALNREVGTGTVLPNGKVLLIGANKRVVLYDPATNNWTVSNSSGDAPLGDFPTIATDGLPKEIAIQDQPGVMLPDGKYLFMAGSADGAEPSYFFEYDYVTDSITMVPGGIPDLPTTTAWKGRMLQLPNGQILANMGGTIYIASPSGTQLSSFAPAVVRIDQATTTGLTYKLIGTQMNGFSQGATYGHSASMDTNFPIVRVRDPSSGLVKYAKAYSWTPGLSASSAVETSLYFDLPTGFTQEGIYDLNVIVNGIASTTVVFKPNDMVKDIYIDSTPSDPKYLTDVNGTVFFVANDGLKGDELWKSDGTKAGTVLLKDIRPGFASSTPKDLMNVNGTLYFTADDGKNGVELWKSDGTAAGTVMVADIYTGKAASNPSSITSVNGTLYFSAITAKGAELWKSDGTAAGTTMVKDIRTGVLGSAPMWLTAINSTLYFTANNGTQGVELWKSDGTANGTVLVKDIYTGVATSYPQNLMASNGTLYFTASSGITGLELWKSDGTAAGTVLVKDIDTRTNVGSNPKYMTAFNGFVYFQASTLATGAELWRTDGTSAGTFMIKDMNPGKVGSSPSGFHEFNGSLYFQYQDQVRGTELAKSNGTTAGTSVFKNINTTTLNSSHPTEFVNIGSYMYFKAGEGATGIELYRTNGTVAGTTLVKDINFRTGDADPSWMISSGTKLFFTATNGFLGMELFMIDTALLP